jgi:hypothetical protein
MKKILIVFLILLLSACTPPSYARKSDDNENYYDAYLDSIGMVEYEEMESMFSVNDMNDAYQFVGINQTSSSFFIYRYLGEDENGTVYHILIPDKIGEENVVFEDHLPTFEDLEKYITDYNNSTESVEIDWAGNIVNTNDIILDESSLRLEVIWHFYTDRKINDKEVEADTDTIRDLLFSNLTSPFVYQIGKYYDGGDTQKQVFLGKGLDHDLVFIVFDMYSIEVDIVYIYGYEQ